MITLHKKLWLVAVAVMMTATVTQPFNLPSGDWLKKNIGLVVGGAVLCAAAVLSYKIVKIAQKNNKQPKIVDDYSEEYTDINQQDKNGRTPLMRAIITGELKRCEELLAHKDIKIHLEDSRGCNALDYAITYYMDNQQSKDQEEVFKAVAAKYDDKVLDGLIVQFTKNKDDKYKIAVEILIQRHCNVLGVNLTTLGKEILAKHKELKDRLKQDETYKSEKEKLDKAYNLIKEFRKRYGIKL